MYGSVLPRGNCPNCQGKFSERDHYGLYCPQCKTRPTRYKVQASYFGLGYLTSTPRGQVLSSYDIADALLSAIRTAWDESRRGGKPWDIDDWIPRKVKNKRITEIIKQYITSKDRKYRKEKLSKSHWQQISNICNKFIQPYFQSRFIESITEREIQEFYEHLQDLTYERGKREEHYSSKHIKDIMMMFRSLYNYARVDAPPFPDGWDDVEPKRNKRTLTLDMQMQIDPHIPTRHGYRLAISILQATGMRVCELRALLVSDVTDRGVVVWKSLTDRLKRVRKGYAGDQTYMLPKYVMDDLREHIKGKSPDDFIFTVNGSPYKLGTLRDMWYRVLDKLGLPRMELNQAGRHTWASREMQQARDEALARIQKQLGHTNKETSQKHYIVGQDTG
jgi:integrase